MNKFKILLMFFICCVFSQAIPEDKVGKLTITIAGEIEAPAKFDFDKDQLVSGIYKKVKVNKFAQLKWFYVFRSYNIREENSTRVTTVRQQVDKVYFLPDDKFQDVDLRDGDIIIIPSKW